MREVKRTSVVRVLGIALALAPAAARADATVVYGVVPPLFGNPPLQAVTRALPQLEDLGVDVVWLLPVTEVAESDDYGYAVTDFRRVRASYGTEADLRALVDEAHRRGMRVVLDFVPNHTSDRHPWFLDTLARGRASPFFRFYARDEAGAATHYFDWIHLPNLDYTRADVRRTMSDATTSWIQRFALDGFRMDAAWGVRARAPDAWAPWVRDIRHARPGAMLLAEASAREGAWFTDGFDAAYDWTDRIGAWAWEGMFDHPETIAARLRDDLEHDRGPTLRFLENNDTGTRFISRHGVEAARVASAMLLTLPGLPCLFTGEETGAEYDPYWTTTPIAAGPHPELRAWLRSLVALRKAHPSLQRGDATVLEVSGAPRVVAYQRHDPASGETTLVALNFDAGPARASLQSASGAPRAVDLPPWGVIIDSSGGLRTRP